MVFGEECFQKFSFMAGTIVQKKQYLFPVLQQFFREPDEVALFFSFGKLEKKGAFCSGAKDVGVLVLVVDCYCWTASFFCPASCNKRDEAKRGFVFSGHDKTFLVIVSNESPGFFLKAFISSFDALL